MKKNSILYAICWSILIVIFNVICFVIPNILHDTTFWIGWAFTMLAFIGQLIWSLYIFKQVFYKISPLVTSYVLSVVNVIVGSVCMAVAAIPAWVAIILCLFIVGINIFAMMRLLIAKNIVEEIDEKIKKQTMTIKLLTIEAEGLVARAANEDAKAECRRVYEAIRYSDPRSVQALLNYEEEIGEELKRLGTVVSTGDHNAVHSISEKIILLVNERNAKCKLLK